MQHTIAPERLQAARHALNDISRAWTFTHPTTGCFCRSEFDGAILRTEVVDGPPGLDTSRWWDADANDDAIAETLDDLDRAGVIRTAVSDARSAERELRLITDAIRELV